MALTKETEIEVYVLVDGQLQVRESTIVLEDGIELSRTYHRHVVDIGDDVTGEAQIVQDIAGAIHTSARIAARIAFRAK